MDSETGDGPPRALLVTALVVAVAGIVAVLTIAVMRQESAPQRPVPVAAVPAPAATSSQCADLLADLPDELGDQARAPLADPAPPGAAAWRAEGGGEPIVLRCGVERPAEFVAGAPVQVVDDVQWFRVSEPGAEATEVDQARSTWFAVDRGVYVALTLPQGSGPTPIQLLSAAIAKALPAKPVVPGPPR
ncbi:DUF3515 domain-containing protein [Mycobacterium sp. 1164985.4]|uniref:DUF3515 domain-containing protein n=1 Tax=Mycobacterium sp. 1164985.4 TaxID=1834069 RepID=UPI0007FD1B1F|nr:DUF3515 domain-containing protein [Mycobacterium sp. 1164985.4]OBK76518.1 hypothetical protein A5650_14955 [Mycobacterium sp. 1164985.4]